MAGVFQHSGRCSCGQVTIRLTSAKDLPDQATRQCDCDYCARHGTPLLLSDPEGSLEFSSSDNLRQETQGSDQASMLFCPECREMIGAAIQLDGHWKGVVNGHLLADAKRLPAPQVVSPKTLSPEEKTARWAQIWTPLRIPPK